MIVNYRQLILKLVNYYTSIRAEDLSLKMFEDINPHIFKKQQYDSALNELMEKGDLVYLFYDTPSHGTKIIFFPKGTSFSFNQGLIRIR